MIDGALPHDQSKLKANWGDSTHEIELPQGSVLYSIFDKKQLSVNSYHHQAIKKLAAGFAVAAIAQDGVIESISYIRDGNFVMATQFHPEMMPGQQSECARLFSYFVNQAVKTGAKQQNNQNIKETTGR